MPPDRLYGLVAPAILVPVDVVTLDSAHGHSEGVMKAVKAHRFYSKPSVRKRAKAKAALKYKKQR